MAEIYLCLEQKEQKNSDNELKQKHRNNLINKFGIHLIRVPKSD